MKINKVLFVTMFLFFAMLWPVNASESNDTVIVLSKDNTASLADVVDGASVGAVITSVRKLDSAFSLGFKKKPIYLFMNTPGGSIQSGLELVEALKGTGRPVNTITLFSASMGFQLVQELGERLILRNGVLMSHRAVGKISGEFGGLSPSQLENRLNLWTRQLTEMDLQTVARTKGKQTLQSYQKAYANELWLTGSQALERGYADKIVVVKCDSSLNGVTSHTISFFGIDIAYDLDNCPINTSPMNIRIVSSNKHKGKNGSENQEVNTYTPEKLEELKVKFLDQYNNKHQNVLPLYW